MKEHSQRQPPERVDTKVLGAIVELDPPRRLPVGLRVDSYLSPTVRARAGQAVMTPRKENMGTYRKPLPPCGASGNCSALLWLGATDFNAEFAGRKAASLHSLSLAGLPVAPGFIVAPQLDVNGRGTELEAAVAALGGFPVAARSSSSLEDGEAASFAGQFTTCLFVTDIDALQIAIEQCRQSVRTATVSSYLRKRGLTERDAAPSVLVQAMVEARFAGVAFSIHPGTGREEHALVECCNGLADRLVSGQITPTNYVLSLESGAVLERRAGDENVRLGADVLRTLCDHLLVIQAHYGLPQDVEWALDRDGKIWILQSRPITRIHWHAGSDEFTNANLREGVAARVCTPLMYSLYATTLDRSLPRYLSSVKLLSPTAPPRNWVRMFYGRPYWNATAVKSALCRLPGFDEQVFDQDLGIQREYEAGPIRTPTDVRSILAALPAIVALTNEFRQQLRRTEHYGCDFLPREANYLQLAESFLTMSDREFFSLLPEVLGFHEKTYTDYFTCVFNHTIYQGDFKVFLDRMAAAIGEPISLLALTSGLRDISHMTLQRDFASLVAVAKKHGTQCATWNEALTAFFRVHYFRADAELDISAPRWGECPESVTRMVEQALRTGIVPADPDASASDQFRQFEEELHRIRAAVCGSMWTRMKFGRAFRSRLRMARTYIRRREVLREYSTRVDHLVRRYALEAGRRLYQEGQISDPEDVFMIYKNELNPPDGVMAEKTRAAVKFRRLMYQAYRLFDPPGELGGPGHSESAAHMDEPRGQLILKGTGCSAGRRCARARVITAISEFQALQPGEVLVTRSTDPSWTPLLGLVSGIIAETGGQLSHGAVITREYGLPGVLNVPDATRIIKTGQLVQIDGTKGTVTIIDEIPLSECAHVASCGGNSHVFSSVLNGGM